MADATGKFHEHGNLTPKIVRCKSVVFRKLCPEIFAISLTDDGGKVADRTVKAEAGRLLAITSQICERN